jgi:hypothetical protein
MLMTHINYAMLWSYSVAPAELEGVLLMHRDVTDAAVIGVYSEKEFSEVPRWVLVSYLFYRSCY